jgi:predicted nucleic acid-binding protein
MGFWDASAVIPLAVVEPRSDELAAVLAADLSPVVWWGTRIECVSGFCRRERAGLFGPAETRKASEILDSLSGAWSEVQPGEALRARTERVLAVHPLRAGDALQLGAAITWRGDSAEPHQFVCLDERLRDAASREGFALLPIDTAAGH